MKELTREVLDVIYEDLQEKAQDKYPYPNSLKVYLDGVKDGLEACRDFLAKQ